MIPHPTEVRYIEADGLLRVQFVDDVSIDFPVALLRGFCPCAQCQGHGGGPPTWTPWRHERATIVENVSPVGNYALCIVWGDGHDTGIFSFESLRRIRVEPFDAESMTPTTELPRLAD